MCFVSSQLSLFSMNIQQTSIQDLLIIKPRIFSDDRGYFYESYNKETFLKLGLDLNFVQDNQSLSQKDVLRGLHFQNPPFAQGKLVRVIQGSVLDVAVDIRSNSPTYGQHEKVILSGENKTMFWIPPGFAHGFMTLEKENYVLYGCTKYRSAQSEKSIKFNDKDLKIRWPLKKPILSKRDKDAMDFNFYKNKKENYFLPIIRFFYLVKTIVLF